MDERKEEQHDQDFDEDGFDPTKEAFFSNLMNMEEEIASEAYELVEHGINLIESKFFDDGIEVLRQAIGVYAQINRADEIKAINEKISEVFLLKEKEFREREMGIVRTEEGKEEVELTEEIAIPDNEKESHRQPSAEDLIEEAVDLLNEGKKLVESNNFEEALDNYDDAMDLFEEANNSKGVEKVFELIEECYNAKADYLRRVRKEEPSVEVEEISSIEERQKEEKLQQYLFTKKQEEETSTQAYELIGQAAEIARTNQFDQAIQLYREGAALFKQLNWIYEFQKIQETMEQLERKREEIEAQVKMEQAKIEDHVEPHIHQVEGIEQQVREQEEEEKQAKLERLRSIELQRMETEYFKAQIDNLATEASRMAREYELAMQKAIKKGELIDECVYPKVIEIYNRIKELLIDKGWNNEAAIYDDTINVYIQKFEQDKKIRQIEEEKTRKQKEAKELLKASIEDKKPEIKEEHLGILEERQEEEIEIQSLRKKVDEMSNRAERLARDYEVALRRGKFELECPYPEIINIFKSARQLAIERGWETDAAIFLSQIQAYTQKLEKDKKLRQIEASKAQKAKISKEALRLKEERDDVVDEERFRKIEEQKRVEEEAEDFEKLINDMINKARRMEREYDSAMKKAIKRGKLAENPPYAEIIKIYERVQQMVSAKGRNGEAAAYGSQIIYYSEKWEKDKKLREVEAQKLQKQKEMDELLKFRKDVEVKDKKLTLIERKKEDEEFEKYISNMVNKAEKLVREYEMKRRKAMKKGEILENTPYSDVIKIYSDIREKVFARGWRNQAEVYGSQIQIYQEKQFQHEKLLKVEAEKEERRKNLVEMQKSGKIIELDKQKLDNIEKKKDDKAFQKEITNMVDKAEKLEREYDSAMKKAIKKGEVIEQTPYLEIIKIYSQIRDSLVEEGWLDQVQIYTDQIKIYEKKLEKSKKLLQIEAEKAKKQIAIEEMHKMGKKETKAIQIQKLQEMEDENKEEDRLLDKAMTLIDEAEKLVKDYKLSIKDDVLLYENPYDKVISNYKEAQVNFKKIGWNDEANRLINTIKFYREEKERDDRLREIEQIKLEEAQIEVIPASKDIEKDLLMKEKRVQEFEKQKRENMAKAEEILNKIKKADDFVKDYETEIRKKNFEAESPYERVRTIYQNARKEFEEIGWIEESMKLLNTIKFNEQKFEKFEIIRKLELEKVKKRKEELLFQKRSIEQARKKQEKVIKRRVEDIQARSDEVIEFETEKNKAFELTERAKRELEHNNFQRAIELYQESEKIFSKIGWQEGINMVQDSITMIKRKEKSLELQQKAIKKRKQKEIMLEAEIEEKLVQTEELRKRLQEEKRKEFLKIQSEKQWEKEISDQAYDVLEQGTALLDKKRFDEAYEKYIEARKLFSKISWKREVSRINNDLLFKLRREKKKYEALQDIKKKRLEDQKEMEKLREEAKEKQLEIERQKKEDKRRLAKEVFDEKILKEINKAEILIEQFKYNEAIVLLKGEQKKLLISGREEELKRIDEMIDEVKTKSQFPLIVIEYSDDVDNLEKFKLAYNALDKAQISISNNNLKKTISELKEAQFHLRELKFGEKFIKDIEVSINKFQEKLGRKPTKEELESKDKEEYEVAKLKARIAKRREERRKKVLDLLKKSED
ncbi:MAG: hypothetical protein ACFFEN_03050 [Candidatus Thorarchaeota archaeon]